MVQEVFLISTMVEKEKEFLTNCIFFEKSRQKSRKRVASKRRKFEDFTYKIKKQKVSSSEDGLFSPTATEGSLTQELP